AGVRSGRGRRSAHRQSLKLSVGGAEPWAFPSREVYPHGCVCSWEITQCPKVGKALNSAFPSVHSQNPWLLPTCARCIWQAYTSCLTPLPQWLIADNPRLSLLPTGSRSQHCETARVDEMTCVVKQDAGSDQDVQD